MRLLLVRLLFPMTLGWNFLLGRILHIRNWWDRVDDYVIIGAFPFPFDVPALQRAGVRAVVNTCEEYRGPCQAYARAGIEQLRIPTIDFTSPDLESVERAVHFIAEHAAKDESVYVHCKAGRGRSATVVICWLIESENMTPAEAQALLLQKRSHVNRYLAQRPVVHQFYSKRLNSRESADKSPPKSPGLSTDSPEETLL